MLNKCSLAMAAALVMAPHLARAADGGVSASTSPFQKRPSKRTTADGSN